MLIGTAVYLMKELIVTNLSTPSHFPKLHRSLSQADSGLVFITHCPTISTHEDWSETYVNRFELSYISTRWNRNVLALTSASSDPYEVPGLFLGSCHFDISPWKSCSDHLNLCIYVST